MENSAPSSFWTLCKIVETKIGGKTEFENLLNIIPFTLVGYEVIITNSHYSLIGYFITSYATRAHGIIVNYFYFYLFICLLVYFYLTILFLSGYYCQLLLSCIKGYFLSMVT